MTTPDDMVTAPELASWLGVSARSVTDLTTRGIVVRAGRGRYRLAESVRAYCGHLREQAAGRAAGAGLTAEREREARERADSLALRNAVARRDLVPAGEVSAALGGIVRDIRSRMLAVPSRVAQQSPTLARPDVALIEAEIRAGLTEAGNADPAVIPTLADG